MSTTYGDIAAHIGGGWSSERIAFGPAVGLRDADRSWYHAIRVSARRIYGLQASA